MMITWNMKMCKEHLKLQKQTCTLRNKLIKCRKKAFSSIVVKLEDEYDKLKIIKGRWRVTNPMEDEMTWIMMKME